MHHVVILNPAAGKGTAAKQESHLRRLLDEQRIPYELVRTEGPMHAAILARTAAEAKADVVVAAGGDGTCNEVVNGLMTSESEGWLPAMGVLCVGRGNDFAFGAGIPHGIEKGVGVLASGARRCVDVGRLAGCGEIDPRYFCNGVGIGFDTIVAIEAEKMKHVSGFLGYILGALKTIVAFPEAPTVRLSYGGVERTEQSMQISLMNGRRMGGAFYMCPEALPDDGAIDLCMAGRVRRGRMVRLFFKFLKGTQVGEPDIRTERESRFEVTAEAGSLFVHADGETICTDARHLVVECIPKAIEVVSGTGSVPSQEGARSVHDRTV